MLTPLGKKLGFSFLLAAFLAIGIFAKVDSADARRANVEIYVHPDVGDPPQGKQAQNKGLSAMTVINGKFQIQGYQLKTVFSEQTGFLYTCLVPDNYDVEGGNISCMLGQKNNMSANTLQAVQDSIQKAELKLGGVFPNEAIHFLSVEN